MQEILQKTCSYREGPIDHRCLRWLSFKRVSNIAKQFLHRTTMARTRLMTNSVATSGNQERDRFMDKPVRIAFISEHASPVALAGSEDAGGQNVYVDEVSRNLSQLGYKVDVFTRCDSDDTPEVIDWGPGVRVINLPAGPASFILKDELWPFMPAFRDAFLHFMERDEVQYDLIHSNFWMSGWVATELRRWLGIPVVHIFHEMGKIKQRYQESDDHSLQERIAVESQVIRDVDRIIARYPSEQAELVDDYGADPQKVVVIPAAADLEMFCPVKRDLARACLGIASKEFVIVYVGRMLPRKDIRNVVRGVSLLIRQCAATMRKGPKIRLLLVGGETFNPDPVATPEIGELQRLAEELGITQHVQFVGKRPQDELCYFYGAGDVTVTTPWYEPFGLTPLESMACGRPVIGSAVGGITYTIADGETGFLVPPRDPQALADRLYELLKNPTLRRQMGKKGRRRVERKFTWPQVALHTARLYDTLIVKQEQPATTMAEAALTPPTIRAQEETRVWYA
jgi:glycosyltransferase involved in cell wall biosynthesis